MAILAVMLILTVTQAFVIEPRAAAIKNRCLADTTPKDHPARVQFRKLHGLSMAANLAVIAGGVVLLVLSSLPGAGTTPASGTLPQAAQILDRRP